MFRATFGCTATPPIKIRTALEGSQIESLFKLVNNEMVLTRRPPYRCHSSWQTLASADCENLSQMCDIILHGSRFL